MREPLSIVVAQPPCTALDVAANAWAHAELIREADARLVVFPELSLTGYELAAPAVDFAVLAPIVAACAESSTVALAGAPVAGPRSIGVLAIDGTGVRIAYRKMCLGDAEQAHFIAGSSPAVVTVDGWRIGLAVCKDTGVPAQSAATAELGMDVYAAGLVDHPHEAVVQEQRAQRIAREHGVHVAFASFAGPTGGGYPETAGQSGIWGPPGKLIDRAGLRPGGQARALLTPA